MNLSELIAELEKATELAPHGEMDVLEACDVTGLDGDKPWLSIDKIWVVGPNDAEGLDVDDMQAIAIRHNTASEVLRHLRGAGPVRELNARMAVAHTLVEAECETWRGRAEKAESELESATIHITLIDAWCERTGTEIDLEESPTPPPDEDTP